MRGSSVPSEPFNVVYADPPWRYSNVNTGGSMTSGAANQYPTMSIEDLCGLPVRHIVRSDAVLFLWTTTPLLLQTPGPREVIKAWGFDYKTLILWDKAKEDLFGEVTESRLGMGMWFRTQTELLVLGVRGAVKPFRSSQRNVIRQPAGGHSAKPSEARRIIERATEGMADRRMVELFARERVAGWTGLGNELDGCDIRKALAAYVTAVA